MESEEDPTRLVVVRKEERMNDDRALDLIRAINRLAGSVGTCAFWLFVIALHTCRMVR